MVGGVGGRLPIFGLLGSKLIFPRVPARHSHGWSASESGSLACTSIPKRASCWPCWAPAREETPQPQTGPARGVVQFFARAVQFSARPVQFSGRAGQFTIQFACPFFPACFRFLQILIKTITRRPEKLARKIGRQNWTVPWMQKLEGRFLRIL